MRKEGHLAVLHRHTEKEGRRTDMKDGKRIARKEENEGGKGRK
jgi:hypothetical protein